jgi:hypothetical protein
MRHALRTLAVALIAHVVVATIALLTAVAALAELRARNVDYLDPESVLEMFVRDGVLAAPVNVVIAGLVAALCVSPFLEIALAGVAARGASLSETFRGAARFTPASAFLALITALVMLGALGLAMLAPWGVYALTDEVFDDRARAGYVALASAPALAVLLGFGVAVDVGRIHLSRGELLLTAVSRGLRATLTRLFPFYVSMLALGVAASITHACMGRNDDASSLAAGGVILLLRPLSRAVFMLVAARHDLDSR